MFVYYTFILFNNTYYFHLVYNKNIVVKNSHKINFEKFIKIGLFF